jgi:hypothetical protein
MLKAPQPQKSPEYQRQMQRIWADTVTGAYKKISSTIQIVKNRQSIKSNKIVYVNLQNELSKQNRRKFNEESP